MLTFPPCAALLCCSAGILAALKDKSSSSSSLKIEALTFLRSAMESNEPSLFQGVLPDLGKALFAAAQERYYKVRVMAFAFCATAR